jgi:benzylsuccinate CoA-transferase BbsF subunit
LAYTDYVSPRFTMCALLAALDHRRRTGEGQYLDFSQAEAATHLLAPALLEFQRTGVVVTRAGNTDPQWVPHALYPALGDDGWVAIVCRDDEEWRSLAIEMRRPDLAGLTTAERRAREAELDEVIGAWTARQDPSGLQHRLQAMGVPTHRMQNTGQVIDDAQLADRGHFVWVDHPYVRRSLVDNPAMQLSRTPGRYTWGGPTAGQHASEILEGILGYDGERIADLAIAGALE